MAKAFTELPQFFAETAQEVEFDSIIAEEGLDELEGKKCIVLLNLEPKKLMGIESQGMILAASNEDFSSILLFLS